MCQEKSWYGSGIEETACNLADLAVEGCGQLSQLGRDKKIGDGDMIAKGTMAYTQINPVLASTYMTFVCV